MLLHAICLWKGTTGASKNVISIISNRTQTGGWRVTTVHSNSCKKSRDAWTFPWKSSENVFFMHTQTHTIQQQPVSAVSWNSQSVKTLDLGQKQEMERSCWKWNSLRVGLCVVLNTVTSELGIYEKTVACCLILSSAVWFTRRQVSDIPPPTTTQSRRSIATVARGQKRRDSEEGAATAEGWRA